MDSIMSRREYFLFVLNSYFKKLGLVFTIFRSKKPKNYYSFKISASTCDNVFGLQVNVYPNKNIYIELLSSCQNKSGSEILGRIKKFACKIGSKEIMLEDGQYLDADILGTSTQEMIEPFCYIDIASTGDSWYNKMGFHRIGGNPEEDKFRNKELSKIPLIEIIDKQSDIVEFQRAFEIDTDINIRDPIKNIFTIIKRDYLKNKTKTLTIEQLNIINHILSKYLNRHFIYDTKLYYNPNCNISQSSFKLLRSLSSLKKVSTRRKTFNDFGKKSKSRNRSNPFSI
jgi:hypothetical protein